MDPEAKERNSEWIMEQASASWWVARNKLWVAPKELA